MKQIGKVRDILSRIKTIVAASAAILSLHMTATAAELSDWAVNDYIESSTTGLLSYRIASSDWQSNITREEFCELAINLYEKITNEELRVPAQSPFTDCDNIAVSQAYYNGIVKGVTDTEFAPNNYVTRQEMAQMLVNTLNAGEVSIKINTDGGTDEINSFSDYEQVSDWARSAISTMAKHDLMSGNSENEIMPLTNATREQAVTCVNRCYKTFSDNQSERYMLPSISSPVDGSSFQSGAVNISWMSAEGASSYYVIVKDSDENTVFSTQTGADVLTATTSALSDGIYYITVGALMDTGDYVFGLPAEIKVGTIKIPEVKPVTPAAPVVESASPKAQEILNEAAKYLGIKYVYGGSTPDGFDCSGFVKYVFEKCGITLKRTSRDQYASNGVAVEKSQLQPGDLVFFGSGGTVGHVGIYVGGGEMIHSPSTGKSICYTSINSTYYTEHYIGAKRVI